MKMNGFINKLIKYSCYKFSPFLPLCFFITEKVMGPPKKAYKTLFQKVAKVMPGGSNEKQFYHYFQLIDSGKLHE